MLRPSIGQLAAIKETTGVRIEPWKYGAKAALCISADFELAWAFQYAKGDRASDAGVRTRACFDRLLRAFQEAQIPVTWAVVGHLLLNGCSRDHGTGLAHADLPRPPPYSNRSWSFETGDWYQHDPCTSLSEDSAWYAPDLIDRLLSSPGLNEIGCHSFSHTDFSDRNCPPELARAELEACQGLAAKIGVRLKSFVFPGNFEGNHDVLASMGFVAYRGSTNAHLSYPFKAGGAWNLPGSLQLFDPVVDYGRRIPHYVEKALETGTLLHLNFHPSELDSQTIERTLVPALRYLKQFEERGLIWFGTMDEIAGYCEARGLVVAKATTGSHRLTGIDIELAFDSDKYSKASITLSLPWVGSIPRCTINGVDSHPGKNCFAKNGRLFITIDHLSHAVVVDLT